MWYSNVAIMKFNKCCKIEIDLRCNDSCCHLHSLSISAELTKPIHVSYFFLHGLPCCYLRHFSAIFLVAWVTLAVPLMCVRFGSYPSLSLRTSISASSSSFTSSRASCPLVVAQVSAPYNRAGLATVLSQRFNWHPPVAQHSTASLPVPQCFTGIFHTWIKILETLSIPYLPTLTN